MDRLSYSWRWLRGMTAAMTVFVAGSFTSAAELTCATKTVEFKDAYAGCQLLMADGQRDVTREAKYISANPAVARVDSRGYITPAGNGATTIQVSRSTDRL